jgi:hypothetical protein
MANDTSTGYTSTWNVPNITAPTIFTADAVNYPFLSRLGGVVTTQNDEFAMSGRYAHETAAQPAINEAASVTAPTAIAFERVNELNVTQIFHEAVNVTYLKMSNASKLRYAEISTSSYATSAAPGTNPVADEVAFQKMVAMQHIYRDYEYSALIGTFAKATSASVANKMRGILPACTISTVDGSAAAFTKALADQVLLEMANNGAEFGRPVIFCTASDKQRISNEYGFVPADRTMGGLGIDRIQTDFGVFEVIWNRLMPSGYMLFADMSKTNLVIQPVPGLPTIDGIIGYEELSKTGASEKGQLYAQLGIDYGSAYFHGSLTNLAA